MGISCLPENAEGKEYDRVEAEQRQI